MPMPTDSFAVFEAPASQPKPAPVVITNFHRKESSVIVQLPGVPFQLSYERGQPLPDAKTFKKDPLLTAAKFIGNPLDIIATKPSTLNNGFVGLVDRSVSARYL